MKKWRDLNFFEYSFLRLVRPLLSAGIVSIFLAATGCCVSQKTEYEPLDAAVYLRCREILRNGIRSEHFWPCIHAAEGLTAAGDGHIVLNELTTRIEDETDDQRRCGLARELIRAGDESKVHILIDVLSDPESSGRVHAAESLFKVHFAGDPALLIKCKSDSTNAQLQIWACAALVRAGYEQHISMLRQFLLSGNPRESSIAAYLLGQIGDRRSRKQLEQYRKELNEPLYSFFYTAGMLYMDGSDDAFELEAYLCHNESVFRGLAAYTAGDLSLLQYRPQLVSLLDDPDLDVRIRSAHALLKLRQQRASGF